MLSCRVALIHAFSRSCLDSMMLAWSNTLPHVEAIVHVSLLNAQNPFKLGILNRHQRKPSDEVTVTCLISLIAPHISWAYHVWIRWWWCRWGRSSNWSFRSKINTSLPVHCPSHHTKLTFPLQVYTGERDEEGRRHGGGTAVLPNKDSFTGQYHQGHRHGHGKYTWANGCAYEGRYLAFYLYFFTYIIFLK